jgi:dienelactone hydrolase
MRRSFAWAGMLLTVVVAGTAAAQVSARDAAFYVDFSHGPRDQAAEGEELVLYRLKHQPNQPLVFSDALQRAEFSTAAMKRISRRLDGIKAMTVGGWFNVRRRGEQTLFCRELPTVAPLGERMFRPREDFVNFCIGTDERGFFHGTIHGNGRMPFPLVTLCEVKIDTWNQLVVVKHEDGHQSFYNNGALVFSDRESAWGGVVRPFKEAAADGGEPIRLTMPQGGQIGETWVFGRELSAAEITADYQAKRERYRPAHPGKRVVLREMDAHHSADPWRHGEPTKENWPDQRKRILAGVEKILGPMPDTIVPLAPQSHGEVDCGTYIRRKISFAVQPNDRMIAYLLVPKKPRATKVPAVICFYGTTSGAGKETTVGLSGGRPGSKPEKNRGFAIDMVEAGFVAFAADYLRDGERVKPGERPYDSTSFYKEFPAWSVVGKDAWDNARACDYLQSLEFVDGEKIGMVGHSYGGHSTIFATALEPRIKVAVSNGPVSDFLGHGDHWGRPIGHGGGEYIRGLRPYVLDHTKPLPVTFSEFTALIAPRPLLVGQAVGERRPHEEENHAAVKSVYAALGQGNRVGYHWYAGDHDFPPEARKAAVEWLRRWFDE